jgi:pimeloyl-ACP methyl ester carboxylesterase
VVALRHALETPQPLKSQLPGEALLYRWQRRSIFYKVLGSPDAPPLVLLHTPDIGASAYEMQHILAPLASTYRVYALDLLGFGLSDRPVLDYSASLYHTLCQDFLRDVVKRPATLLASGLSCNYAVSVAANAPDLCTALVLISPIALQSNQQAFPLSDLVETPLAKTLLYPLLSTRPAFLLMHGRQQTKQTDFAQFYAQTHQLGAEHAPMALLAGKLAENMARQFAMLKQPILMIWGVQALENPHAIASMRNSASQASLKHQAREVEIIQQAGIAVHEEQPDSVVAAIRRWQAEMTAALPLHAETRADTFAAASLLAEPTDVMPVPEAALQPQQAAHTTTKPEPVRESLPHREPSQQAQEAETDDEQARPLRENALPTTAQASSSAQEPTQPDSGDRPNVQTVTAYCVKCKEKREILDVHEVKMKNGRLAVRGKCAVCGTNLNRIGGLK